MSKNSNLLLFFYYYQIHSDRFSALGLTLIRKKILESKRMTAKSRDLLVSGKTSFKIEVPYKLIESGTKKRKPLIVYLHGYGENIDRFIERCDPLIDLDAYHLFIQGPYPIFNRNREKKISEWGRAWYLYDGDHRQFLKSLEVASEFIQGLIDQLLPVLKVSRLCVLGYSMGGYLAGYFALTRWKHVNDLVVAGARIKTEVLEGNWEQIRHLNIVALHGKKDDKVLYEPQQKEINILRENGVNAELKLLDENHSFSENYIQSIKKWFQLNSYVNG